MVAADLTHLMNRQTIAAGTLPNTYRGSFRMDSRSAGNQARKSHASSISLRAGNG
jgi:hypothetical protein